MKSKIDGIRLNIVNTICCGGKKASHKFRKILHFSLLFREKCYNIIRDEGLLEEVM